MGVRGPILLTYKAKSDVVYGQHLTESLFGMHKRLWNGEGTGVGKRDFFCKWIKEHWFQLKCHRAFERIETWQMEIGILRHYLFNIGIVPKPCQILYPVLKMQTFCSFDFKKTFDCKRGKYFPYKNTIWKHKLSTVTQDMIKHLITIGQKSNSLLLHL